MRLMAITALMVCLLAADVFSVDYPIVYVRAPRAGNATRTAMPDIFHPLAVEPGTDLMLLHPDGSEEVLVESGTAGCAMDPAVSLDGGSVYYAFCPDVTDVDAARKDLPRAGWDIYRINVATRAVTRLTFQEWTPNEGSGNWSSNPVTAVPSGTNYLGFGIVNTAPCPIPGGRVVFTSSRNSYLPNKNFTDICLQLFAMDDDGKNVEQIGFLNLGSALHPVLMRTGEVMFSSYEAQGFRDKRLWGLWAIYPDGRKWRPLHSAFQEVRGLHFHGQFADGRIAVTDYYNLNNNGFGTIVAFTDPALSSPPFGTPTGVVLPSARTQGDRAHFPPPGLENLTTFSTGHDIGVAAGKVKQPSAAPGGDALLVYTPGPANRDKTPVYDSGIYILPGGQAISSPSGLVAVKQTTQWNEEQPVALVPWANIHGQDPPELPWLPDAADAFGWIGTSDVRWRNTAPWTSSANWIYQGADLAGGYADAEIAGVRLVVLEPQTWRSRGPNEVRNQGFLPFATASGSNAPIGERHRILGDIALEEDGSFLAKIPADVPFTFQTLDSAGRVLNMAQTWHQVRPGERRTDCGGCHAHNRVPKDFAISIAGQPGYQAVDLTAPPVDVEWGRDVAPIVGGTYSAAVGASIPYQSRVSSLYASFPNPLVARWIDLGCPDDTGPMGWFHDELKPTLVVLHPRRDEACGEIRWGEFDFTGIGSRSVTADWSVEGRTAGAELADLAVQVAPGVWRIAVDPETASGTVTIRVVDGTGHGQRHERSFAGEAAPSAPPLPPEDCDNGLDDDGDGLTDCDDPDCQADPACPTPEQVMRAKLQAWIAEIDAGASAAAVTAEICGDLCQ